MSYDATVWSDPAWVRTSVSFLTCAGVALSSLEWLVPWRKLDADGLLAAGSFPPNGFEHMWRAYGIRIVLTVRLLLACGFLLSVLLPTSDPEAGWAMLLAGVASLPLRLHDPVGVFAGMDGAEHLMTSVCLTVGCSYLLGSRLAMEAALAFVALQAVLEYASAGWVKVRDWRNWASGVCLLQVFRSSNYGHPGAAAMLGKYPALGRYLSISVIVLEAAMPLALGLPAPGSELLLLAALAFHITTAAIMGLNTFVWAFAATYPAILHCRGWLYQA